MFRRNILQSFKFALKGLIFVLKNERNMRLHWVIAVLTIILAACIKISSTEWIFVCFAIALVLIAEVINTAFELLLDYINGKEFHSTVKMLKDIAAAGVLLAAINAVIVGGIIFFT